jgi:hypothetical protein
VAAGDGDRSLSTPLTRYYTEHGTPTGRWVGSGIASLESHLKTGDEVTEDQLRLLIGKRRHPVAGYDLTFSIPKSASVLWGVANAGTQAIIADAHHAAVADVTGVVATAFDHYDSRVNDPHLHTHVVISNRVKATRDGQWRTIDGAPLHGWTVATSELHEAIFSDHLTRARGRRLGTMPSRTGPEPSLGDHWRAAVVGRTVLQPLPRHQRRDRPAH